MIIHSLDYDYLYELQSRTLNKEVVTHNKGNMHDVACGNLKVPSRITDPDPQMPLAT
jgi:hypothetical protein